MGVGHWLPSGPEVEPYFGINRNAIASRFAAPKWPAPWYIRFLRVLVCGVLGHRDYNFSRIGRTEHSTVTVCQRCRAMPNEPRNYDRG